MYIRYGFDIDIVYCQRTPLIAMIDLHPEERRHLSGPEAVLIRPLNGGEPETYEPHRDVFGNICRRIIAPPEGVSLHAEGVIHRSGYPDPQKPGARRLPPEELPPEVLQYLSSSRYCEADRLSAFAWSQFGAIPDGWSMVEAVTDFVHAHLRFDYAMARNTRTALEAFEERTGVCRDFAHLAIALCRALNIPSRYCTGYLGDIGVPRDPSPMDFSAWFEVYLEDAWWTFDARHNMPRIGRIVIGRGRDAADVPIINSFGPHQLGRFSVVTEEVVEA